MLPHASTITRRNNTHAFKQLLPVAPTPDHERASKESYNTHHVQPPTTPECTILTVTPAPTKRRVFSLQNDGENGVTYLIAQVGPLRLHQLGHGTRPLDGFVPLRDRRQRLRLVLAVFLNDQLRLRKKKTQNSR